VEKDIWQNLHEFYLLETEKELKWKLKEIKEWLHSNFSISFVLALSISSVYKQQLTHQNLSGKFIKVYLQDVPASLQGYSAVSVNELNKLAFPKFINQYLQDHPLEKLKTWDETSPLLT
jgi:A/G-specific adenine glycosylase